MVRAILEKLIVLVAENGLFRSRRRSDMLGQ